MKASPYYRPSPSPLRGLVLTMVAVLLGGGGLFVVLVATGVVELPLLRRPAPARPKLEGVPIPLAARAIPAYSKVERGHVMDEKGSLMILHLPAEQVKQTGLLTFEQINGRVLKTDKAAGYAFTERDFLPKGTRPGLLAGVPYGKRAFQIDADKIEGIDGLQIGDRIDVLGALTVDVDKAMSKLKGVAAAATAAHNPQHYSGKRYGARVLVNDGVVVAPLKMVPVPALREKLGHDGKPKMVAMQRLTIAVDPAEVPVLTAALCADAFIYCVGRSGLPEAPPAANPGMVETFQEVQVQARQQVPQQPDAVPDLIPKLPQVPVMDTVRTPIVGPVQVYSPTITVMETIRGSKRELLIFPGNGGEPSRLEPNQPWIGGGAPDKRGKMKR